MFPVPNSVTPVSRRLHSDKSVMGFIGAVMVMLCAMYVFMHTFVFLNASADNFTDVFYTNSFRGSFEWFKHLDWIGMVVQAVISIFALIGTALIVIRIMTSMLYLSARGLWEEVHDLKDTSESEIYDFGFLNMAKSWAKGKGGFTGLDAIIGAILVLLPDVKRYSDFGDKSGQKFEEDTSISQYMLKILLPTVLSVFFLAMAFNGTLVKGLAVTVDAMGTVADRCVSVNYAGFVDDLVNQNVGYKFVASYDGTNFGKLLGGLQKEVYGKAVSKMRGAGEAQLYSMGKNVEAVVNKDNVASAIASSTQVSEQIKGYLGVDGAAVDAGENADAVKDRYYGFIGYDVVVGGSAATDGGDGGGVISFPLSAVITGQGADGASGDVSETQAVAGGGDAGTYDNQYVNIYFKQTKSFDGSYFNTDQVAG